MLTVVKCPHCRRLIGTDQEVGLAIPCPHCRAEFEIERHMLVRSSPLKNALIKLCIPLGYVLFVAVPMGFTIWFFANRGEEQEKAQPEVAEVKPGVRPPVAPRPQPRQQRPKRDDPDPPRPRQKPKQRPDDPEPEVTEPPVEPAFPLPPAVAVAPAPRERIVIPVAPEPHAPLWPATLSGSPSAWQKVGAVDVRVAGFAVAKVPLVSGGGRESESPRPLLVVVTEVRINTTTKTREFVAWRRGQEQPAALFKHDGEAVPAPQFQLGTKLGAGPPDKQAVPADGTPVRGVLLFAVPPDGAGELKLRLGAERCGEFGDIWFTIPADSWKTK